MSNKVTGNEPAYPFFEPNENGYGNAIVLYSADGSKQFINFNPAMTLRQKALLEFMKCLLLNHSYKDNHNGFRKVDRERLSEEADLMTTAYINQLNKEI